MKWFSLVSIAFVMLGTLLCASPVAYADDPPDEDSDMEVDIGVDGDLEVDIKVSGPAELNVGVEGPSEVHIDAGDEVELNVEASDESQVFVDDEKVNDNPGDAPDDPNVEASDPYQAIVSDQKVNDTAGNDDTSRLNSMAIISGVFLAVGLLAFFLVRRKAKKG